MMKKFSRNSDSDEKTLYHERQHRKSHCDQQSDRFLKLTPLLQVNSWNWHHCCKWIPGIDTTVARSSPVLVVCQTWVASWSGCFKTALFRILRLFLRLTFYGKRFAAQQTLIFVVIIPNTSLYGVCHCLFVDSEYIARSNATSSNKTLPFFTADFAFRILLYIMKSVPRSSRQLDHMKTSWPS